jgi:dipeptidyl aminopeptidase/acylaminoacyl peptidase
MSVETSPVTLVHPARRGPRPVTAEDLWQIPRVGAPIPSPDGTRCVVTVTSYDLETNEGKGRLWLVPASGEPRALTSPDFSSAEPAFSPDGRQIAFTRKNEKKKAQLHVMPLDGGEARRVTDLPLGAFDPTWLPDGSGIVFAANLIRGHLTPEATAAELERRDKDPVKAHVTEERFFRFWDTWLTTGEVPHLFLYDLASAKLRDLTPESTTWFDWMEPCGHYDVSPDGREIAYSGIAFDDQRSLIRASLYVVAVAGGGKPQCLTADHPADDNRPRYSPDGKRIVYGMQHDPLFYADRVRIMSYDRAEGTHRPLFESWDRSPSRWCFDREGALYLEAEEDARVSAFAWPGTGDPKPVVKGGSVAGLATAGGRLFFTLQNISQAPEVHAAARDGQKLERLTRFTEPAMARFGSGEVREMRYEGAYGEIVQMYVVLPPNHEEGKQYPLVQQIHGGPHATSGDMFHFRWSPHAFASPGYVVALVNFQGSTSWGQDFAQRIQGGWGDRPFQDVMRGTDVLVASGIVDEKRMAAAGGSYGGYMASWIEGHTDRFQCIVNHAGVYDLLSQYASDITQGRAKSMGGEPWDGLEAIDRWNPARFASGFKTPMLVIHGERDFRVPVTQGLECYGVLKAKGVPARLVYFPDENHWVLKPRNSLLWYREVLGWLERFLGKA